MDWLGTVVTVRYTLSALVLAPGDRVLAVRSQDDPDGLYRLPGTADREVSDPYELMATVAAETGLTLPAGRVLAEDIVGDDPRSDSPLRIHRVLLFPRVPDRCPLTLAGGLEDYRWLAATGLAAYCGEQTPLIETALTAYRTGTSPRLHNGVIVTERRAA
ncbi:hypothetical protein [Streptomyces chrestomyceticus]|uniref:hypothetical protein n=1 Tax=Streptomyces chrestomyceticus TaxID=68185 RepID=UPI00340D7DC0